MTAKRTKRKPPPEIWRAGDSTIEISRKQQIKAKRLKINDEHRPAFSRKRKAIEEW